MSPTRSPKAGWRQRGAISMIGCSTNPRRCASGCGKTNVGRRPCLVGQPITWPRKSMISTSNGRGPHRTPGRRPASCSSRFARNLKSRADNSVRRMSAKFRNAGWRTCPIGADLYQCETAATLVPSHSKPAIARRSVSGGSPQFPATLEPSAIMIFRGRCSVTVSFDFVHSVLPRIRIDRVCVLFQLSDHYI